MIGRNTLELNEATIIAAVQMYLDSMMKAPMSGQPEVKVCGVKSSKSGVVDIFSVSLDSTTPTNSPEAA